MDRIGIRELRQNASRYVERVKAGESIEVTDRGVPVAMLVPAQRDEVVDRLVREGRLIPAAGPWIMPEPGVAREGAESTAVVLDDLRSERL